MLVLYIKAPFAAYRPFVAGSYRQTAPFITPTGAYGLLLNMAGIESRKVDPNKNATDMADDLPTAKVAIGMIHEPSTSRLLQQLHNYPVGNTGKEHAPNTKGTKYNIQPIMRELLVGIEGYLAIDGNSDLENKISQGISGGLATKRTDGLPRYGVPFLGDNSLMLDIVEEISSEHRPIQPARWYCPIDTFEDTSGPLPGTCRMPIWIDRNDMSRTRSDLFAPCEPSVGIPDSAWTNISPL